MHHEGIHTFWSKYEKKNRSMSRIKICAFGHILTLSNIKIILSLLNMRVQAMLF